MSFGIFHQPKNTLPRIDELYAFVSVDEQDGNEGLVAAPYGGQMCLPLIAADKERLKVITPLAERLAQATKQKIRLIKLSHREVIKDISP